MVKQITLQILFIFASMVYIFSENTVDINLLTERNNVGVDEPFQVNLEISGTKGNVSIEDMGELDPSIFIRQTGTMSNMSMVNGSISTSLTIVFYVKISKQGNYSIGPITISIKDKKYKSNVIDINVNSSNTQSISSNQKYENNDSQESKKYSNQSYLFELNANKEEAYINEPIDLSVNFFMEYGAKPKNYQALTFPTTAWIENYTSEDNCIGRVRKNSRNYTLYELEKQRLFITKPGTYTIEPAIIDFYGIKTTDVFSNYEPMTLKTKPLNIKIIPLPENAPKGFDGAVGTFQLTSDIKSSKLDTKESTTLEIILSGNGNFQNIENISFNIDNSIEVYSTNSRFESGKDFNKKIWEILLVPSQPGKFNIKINDFSFFDTNKKEYLTIQGKEYTLKVENSNKKINSAKEITKRKEETSSKAAKDIQIANFDNIHYLQLKIGRKNSLFPYTLWSKIIISLYIIIIFLLSLFILLKYIIFSKLKKIHLSECKNAYKYFTHDISLLRKNINAMHYQNCTDKISNVLEKYFIKKFGIDSIEFTKKGIEKKLYSLLSEENINNLKEIIIKLDMIRFGGEEISIDNCKELINIIKNNIEKIEHNNKR